MFIAAIAIAHEMPLATLNIRDFALINAFFPLPGIYQPIQDQWLCQQRQTNLLSPPLLDRLRLPWLRRRTPRRGQKPLLANLPR